MVDRSTVVDGGSVHAGDCSSGSTVLRAVTSLDRACGKKNGPGCYSTVGCAQKEEAVRCKHAYQEAISKIQALSNRR
jgi:hypothetical protein